MATTTEQERIAKLPQWAQRRIDKLERDMAAANAKLAAGPEDSDTFADPYADTPRPLGQGPTIEFSVPGEGRPYFQARLEGDRLRIMGHDSVAVYPRASNVVEIGVEPRG